MKRIQIYKINEKLFFVPTFSVGKIYSKMILPILESSLSEGDFELGRIFIETFKLSVIGETLEGSSGAFKKLIDIAKVRSHKNLIKTAEFMIVTYDEGVYSLKRVGGNVKHKAFMEDIGIRPIELKEENIGEEKLGSAVKDLFNKPKSIPVTIT